MKPGDDPVDLPRRQDHPSLEVRAQQRIRNLGQLLVGQSAPPGGRWPTAPGSGGIKRKFYVLKINVPPGFSGKLPVVFVYGGWYSTDYLVTLEPCEVLDVIRGHRDLVESEVIEPPMEVAGASIPGTDPKGSQDG